MSAADFDEGYRQGRRDTRAEYVQVVNSQRTEIVKLNAVIDELRRVLGLS